MPNHAPLCSKHRPRSGKPRPAPARAQVSGRDPRGVQRGELGMMVLWDSGDHGESGGLGGGGAGWDAAGDGRGRTTGHQGGAAVAQGSFWGR